MSIKIPPSGFTFDFGSTLTVLTTAARGVHRGKLLSLQGIFTGVVLDDAELNLMRGTKHISISMDAAYFGQEESGEKETQPDQDTDNSKWPNPEKYKEQDKWPEPDKEEDQDKWANPKKCKDDDKWPEPDKEEDQDKWANPKECKDDDKWPEPDKDEDHGKWPKPDTCKVQDKWPDTDKDEEHEEWAKPDKEHHKYHKPHCHVHKHHKPHFCDDIKCEPKCVIKDEEYLVLSLTRPSFPFVPGQIVWISLDQIVALSACHK